MAGNNYPAAIKRLSRLLPDRAYLHLRYLSKFRKFAHLRHPKTYNEKLQWLKLNYRVPGEWVLVDKAEVKNRVAELIGDEYLIPTLGLYESVDEIDFDALPDAFVLKCTHDSGGVVLAPDKSALDRDAARRKLDQTMAKNYFYGGREPHYRHIRPRIIAEPFLQDGEKGQLLDYKFFCFDGEVKALFIASDRASGHVKFDYFDADFRPLGIRQPYPNSEILPSKPHRYEEMLEIARTLSAGHPHVRVDLYEVDGRVYFGELTFYHFGGMQPFHPEKWDRIWGDWLTLPSPVRG
nr:glycosyl transferase [Actinomycetota bacterium]